MNKMTHFSLYIDEFFLKIDLKNPSMNAILQIYVKIVNLKTPLFKLT